MLALLRGHVLFQKEGCDEAEDVCIELGKGHDPSACDIHLVILLFAGKHLWFFEVVTEIFFVADGQHILNALAVTSIVNIIDDILITLLLAFIRSNGSLYYRVHVGPMFRIVEQHLLLVCYVSVEYHGMKVFSAHCREQCVDNFCHTI